MKNLLAKMSNFLHEHRKSILAGLAALVPLLISDTQWFHEFPTNDEWWALLVAVAGAAGLTSWIPNRNYMKVTNDGKQV